MKQNQHNILYSCVYQNKFGGEQLVAEHALSLIISGRMEFYTPEGTKEFGPGSLGLIRRNQLAKTQKMPDADGRPYKSISVIFDQPALRNYAAQNTIPQQAVYTGETMIALEHNPFLRAYFDSLLPYFELPQPMSPAIAELKTKEAIELLLQSGPILRQFLFDFSEPYKIDLGSFMLKNFSFNIPLAQFARLSGRSLSTFKRDFNKTFATPPEQWLREKRLETAHYLIAEKNQRPSDVYLLVGFENFSHFSNAFKQQYGYNASSV